MESSVRFALAATLLLVLAPTFGATTSASGAVSSGPKPMEPMPAAQLSVDGTPRAAFDGSVSASVVRFTVSAATSFTYDGNLTLLDAYDEVRLESFSGYLSWTGSHVRFAGHSIGWTLCSDDQDDDGLAHCDEQVLGTDPEEADSDSDGLLDGEEVYGTTNPYTPSETDPLDADTDDDGLSDGAEVDLGTDPNDADTDDGGADDGTEATRGTDPFDDTDDFYGVYASLTDSAAVGGSPMDVEWVGVNPHMSLEHGNQVVFGIDLTVQHDGGQWIVHNGTDTHISNGFRFTLFDFRGEVTYASDTRSQGVQDILSFEGIARAMEVRNITNEQEAVRTKVLVEQDAAEGKLRLSTYAVVADQPVQPTQHAEVDLAFPVPIYVEFDIWKGEDQLTEVGVYHIGVEEAQHEGTAGYWLILYNEDPVIYQHFIPFRAPLMPYRSIRVCIMTEAPFWCGGFENW